MPSEGSMDHSFESSPCVVLQFWEKVSRYAIINLVDRMRKFSFDAKDGYVVRCWNTQNEQWNKSNRANWIPFIVAGISRCLEYSNKWNKSINGLAFLQILYKLLCDVPSRPRFFSSISFSLFLLGISIRVSNDSRASYLLLHYETRMYNGEKVCQR